MVYFAYLAYNASSAVGNRMLSYLKSLDKEGIALTVVFFIPGINRDKVNEEFQNIKFKYYWDENDNPSNLLFRLKYLKKLFRFLNCLKKGDTVYLYGYEELTYLLRFKKGIKVYYEKTEHPDAVKNTGLVFKLSNGTIFHALRKITGMFVISQALKDYYVSKGIPQDKIMILNMTVDHNRFVDVSKNNAEEKYVAYCGNASNSKDGVDLLIKSFSILHSSHPDIKLFIFGKAPSANVYNENAELVKKLGLEDTIIFKGLISYQNMPQMLKNAEMLVLSRPDNLQAKYGFPTKLGEYLLTGNPVVLTNVGDMHLFLTDKDNAIFCPPNNYEAFAAGMCWVLDNPQKAASIGRNGKETALKYFNAEIESKKMVEFMHLNK